VLIVARNVGEVIRMRTADGDEIEILVDMVGVHKVRLAITAPQTVRIDVRNEKPTKRRREDKEF